MILTQWNCSKSIFPKVDRKYSQKGHVMELNESKLSKYCVVNSEWPQQSESKLNKYLVVHSEWPKQNESKLSKYLVAHSEWPQQSESKLNKYLVALSEWPQQNESKLSKDLAVHFKWPNSLSRMQACEGISVEDPNVLSPVGANNKNTKIALWKLWSWSHLSFRTVS